MKFFHRVAGAKFFMKDGREVCFAGGVVDTSTIKDQVARKELEDELKKVANFPASQIFTQDPIVAPEEKEVVKEIERSATQGFDHVNKIPAGTQTVKVPTPQDPKPVLTADATAGVEMGGKSGGSLNSAMEAAKAAVAAKTAKPDASSKPQ